MCIRDSVLCFTGHKGLMGPQGTGGLCIMNGIEIRPFKVGGSGVQSYSKTQPEEYPTRLEAGTLNGHGIAGLNAACLLYTSMRQVSCQGPQGLRGGRASESLLRR